MTPVTGPGEACFCVGTAPAAGPTTGACAWTHVGPTNIPGRVLDLTIDPTNDSRIFAATVGGVWRSVDGGRKWIRVSDSFLGSKAHAVAVNPANPSEVLVGTGDDQNGGIQIWGNGIWLSTSGGDANTWTKVSPAALDVSVVSRLVYAPDGNTVYAATSAGVFAGTRSGGTLSFSQLGTLTFPTDDIEGDFSVSPALLYAGVRQSGANSGVWKFNGTSWTQENSGLPAGGGFTRVNVAIARSNPSILYAKVAASNRSLAGIFKTTTAAEPPATGTAWTNVPGSATVNDAQFTDLTGVSFFYSDYVAVLEVDPTDPNVLFAGGVGLYRSGDGGSTFSSVLQGPDGTFPLQIHSDQHAIAFDLNNPGIVLSGNDGGVFLSTDTKAATWHWTSRAHGMSTTEFYNVATQENTASLASGGSQDQGTEITFGNHSWYMPGGCDGSTVTVDALSNVTLYSNCNASPNAIVQPVPYAASGVQFISTGTSPTHWNVPAGVTIGLPIVADPTVGGIALAAASTSTGDILLKTTDRLNWSTIFTPPAGSVLSIGRSDVRHRIAISQTSNASTNKTYYVWVQTPTGATVYASQDAGANWAAGTGLTSAFSVNGIAVDPGNSQHAVAATTGAVGGNLFVTTDGGATWTQFTSSGGGSLPAGSVRNVAFDPVNSNIIYVAHQVGVFQGTLSGTSVAWITFDTGLPNGVDVKDISVNPLTGFLTIGTYGFGSYTRNPNAGAACPQQFLVVRDTVFDQGQSPSPSGVADPEHPVSDPNQAGFFKADDSPGGQVYFWDSTDIRVDIPGDRSPANQIASADNVEFESCPVEVGNCAPGTMIDTNPRRNASANAYVQVANRGLQPSTNIRVIAMFTDATVQVPDLPADFWTTTFPAGSTSCGPLNASSPWQLVGCGVIPSINPDYPEVLKFPWNVPANAAEHSCMLVVAESGDDPIPSTIRGQTSTETLVLTDRHLAQRNLHVVPAPNPPSNGGTPGGGMVPFTGVTSVLVPNFTTTATSRTVLLSRSGMGNGRLSFLLPPGVASRVPNLPVACGGSGPPPSGTRLLTISLPKGVTEQSVGVEANGSLFVDDRARIMDPAGGFGGAANAGSGQTNIGASASIGNLTSAAPVTLRSQATIHGFVLTSSPISQQTGVVITGGVKTNATLTPSDQLSWQAVLPSSRGPDVDLEPGTSRTLTPGNYGAVNVKSRSALFLSAGTYVFDSWDVEPQATVTIDTGGGAAILYVRSNVIYRGTIVDTKGGGADVLVVYLGSNSVFFETPFQGSFVAPSASLTLGPTGSGADVGTYFALSLDVRADAKVVSLPFASWPALGACQALTADEKTKAAQLGLDPTAVYPLVPVERRVVLPVAPAGKLTLGLRYESGTGPVDSAARFRAISLETTGAVLGGSTFVVRRQ